MGIIDDDAIRTEFLRAWQESEPGTTLAHEEGGFVLRNDDGSMTVERWPHGTQNQISVPPHSGGRRRGLLIVATFHTHPNPGPDFQQEPSLTDIRAVRYDPDLSHSDYEGEYVIAAEWTYRILKSGQVVTVGETKVVLKGR